MKKIANVFYIVICLSLCAIPFVGMTVAPTHTSTENREMAQLPQWLEDGQWNQEYFQELGEYFNDHFAFRSQLVMADSLVQSKLFGVSNMDTVIVGEEGWLYYSSTLNDYLGTNGMSQRAIFNAANNLSLMKRSVELKGSKFLLTIAPNKNSLYGENMPYYNEGKVSSEKNIEKLEQEIQNMQIPYADLYEVFSEQHEILYLKKDSHWNEKGAVLAYNTILDELEHEHETYETVDNIRTKTEYGDLNKMMYPLSFEPEWNYSYDKEEKYTYVTDTQSVEDPWIETMNEEGTGNMLMFRDSFGNTLLPYMANAFSKAYFSKSVPYKLEEYMDEYSPDYVVVEKAERNIVDFAKEPPVMTGLIADVDVPEQWAETKTTVEFKSAEADADYWEVVGMVDADYIEADNRIYVAMTSGETVTCYEAFTVTQDKADNGYQLYIPKKDVTADDIQLDILVENDTVQKVASVTIEGVSLLGIE